MRARVICPTGKKTFTRENLSSRRNKNIPLRDYPKSHLHFLRPGPRRGAFRDRHGRRAGDAMDAVASGAIMARTNEAAAYGEVVWSWRSDAGAKVVKTF
jgi:hypothetical protein